MFEEFDLILINSEFLHQLKRLIHFDRMLLLFFHKFDGFYVLIVQDVMLVEKIFQNEVMNEMK